MESIENGNQNTNENNKEKKYKMSLLFIQTKELQKYYNQEMEISPKNYYLVDKNWLDNYKEENNYKNATEMLKVFDDWEDYDDFKQKIRISYGVEENKHYYKSQNLLITFLI
jgi:hypothetical protein